MPAQNRQFAGDGHRGDLMSALRPNADEKGAQGPWRLAAAHAASTSIARAWLRPALLMRP
jgi:hypothetical protein